MSSRVRGGRYLPTPNKKMKTSLVKKSEALNLLLKDLDSRKAGSAKILVTLVKSSIGKKPNQVKTVKALGLKKINSKVEKIVNPAILGMVRTVSHLVTVEEIS